VEDAQIIELFFQRNEQAVKETDTAYGRKLYVLSNNILDNREDAEESVSDTYMETWNSIPPKRPKYFYAFLASIFRNMSFNRLDWRLAAKRNAEVVTLTQELEMCIPDSRQDGEMDRRELRRVLETFLDSLSKESRLIFLRRYLYVDTVAEIAARYGISESKVKTQLHRTRAKLHTHLKKEGIYV
jgi:RNA polymerase sigma-70 factor (ECF subfamily)